MMKVVETVIMSATSQNFSSIVELKIYEVSEILKVSITFIFVDLGSFDIMILSLRYS